MSSQTEQEERQEEDIQAVPGQNWRKLLLHLYEDEIVVDAHGREGNIHPNADVVEDTGLDPEQVVAELKYLEEEGLVEWTDLDVDDISEYFVVYRLTADGFKIAQERAEAARKHRHQEKQIDVNRGLLLATFILAINGSMQATTSILSAKQPFQDILLTSFLLLLLFLAIMMIWLKQK